MNGLSFSKRSWIIAIAGLVVVVAAVWAYQAGYLLEIGKFFAAEPGYIPSCAWYGEPVSPTQQCCSGFVPVPVQAESTPVVTAVTNTAESGVVTRPPVGSPLPPTTQTPTPTPTPIPPQYCALPGCKAVQRTVCRADLCEPVVSIICPAGVTPPPPRPTVTPTTSITVSPGGGVQVARGVLGHIQGFKERLSWHGVTPESNPSGGNKLRGLYNITLKSLGAVHKNEKQA